MKKYIEPKINIRFFSMADIVTSSDITQASNTTDATNETKVDNLMSVRFEQFKFDE